MKEFDEPRGAGEGPVAKVRKQWWYEQPDVPLWRLRLRVQMQRGGISVKKLSEKSGLAERAIHGLLEGVQALRFDDMAQLAKGVGVSPAYLAYGIEGKPAQGEKQERVQLMRETVSRPAQVRRKLKRKGMRAAPEVRDARRQSLRRLIDKRPEGMTLNQAGALLGFTRGVIYRLLDEEDPAGCGNIVARRAEQRLGLEEGGLQKTLSDRRIDRAWRFAMGGAANETKGVVARALAELRRVRLRRGPMTANHGRSAGSVLG